MLPVTINLALADDHVLFRKVLADFLMQQKNMQVKLQAGDAVELLNRLPGTPVDVLLLDIFMPGSDAAETVRAVTHDYPDTKIIIVSLCTDLAVISTLLDLGVYAFFSKEEEPGDLVLAITGAYENRIYRNYLFTEALYRSRARAIKNLLKDDKNFLDDREKKILKLLWEEKTNKEIAGEIFLSVRSVEKIRQDMKEKLGVRSMVGLFKHALDEGIISGRPF